MTPDDGALARRLRTVRLADEHAVVPILDGLRARQADGAGIPTVEQAARARGTTPEALHKAARPFQPRQPRPE